MALKFLNKKGWHTGSLRNIENVWKAEQKNEAEQRKLEELRKQIEEERERAEFRQLQEQAGLVPRQERLDFLYDSGLAVGKSSSTEFKAAEILPGTQPESNASKQAVVPGALFEDKPQSANDVWRKLHSDPLLLIRQREQEALARIKNNPVQMAMIRKSVEKKKPKEEKRNSKKHKHHKKTKHDKYLSEGDTDSEGFASDEKDYKKKKHRENDYRKKSKHNKRPSEIQSDSEGHVSDQERNRKRNVHYREGDSYGRSKQPKSSGSDTSEEEFRRDRSHRRGLDYNIQSKHKSSAESDPCIERNSRQRKEDRTSTRHEDGNYRGRADKNEPRKTMDISDSRDGTHHKRRPSAPKLPAEEKAARAREMQLDAELHDEQRWKRLKNASEADAREAARNASSSGSRNFLDAAQKSVYGTEEGGSSTIEESVRRRTHYLQGRSAHEGNAFRR